jgi:tripartite-type tricarboxylate transporter receptor subunit TctC
MEGAVVRSDKFKLVAGVVLACGVLAVQQVSAQNFPERSIRLVVPLAPGGGNDGAARVVAGGLSKRFGQQVVVDNRPGGGSVIASQVVLGLPADGYTLYLFSTNVSMAPLLHAKLPFDTLRDFAPMSRIGTSPGGLIVHPSLPVHKVMDLVALAKARPDQIAFGSSGPGGGSHLGGELFNLLARVKLLHVPYKGSAMATMSVLSGETQVAFNNPTSSMPHIKAGRLRLVAVTTAKRWPLIPGTPTIAESGVKGYEHLIWNGLAVRTGTPKPVFDQLYAGLMEELKSKQLADLLAHDSSLPSPETPEAFLRFLENEQTKWRPVVKQAGISAL